MKPFEFFFSNTTAAAYRFTGMIAICAWPSLALTYAVARDPKGGYACNLSLTWLCWGLVLVFWRYPAIVVEERKKDIPLEVSAFPEVRELNFINDFLNPAIRTLSAVDAKRVSIALDTAIAFGMLQYEDKPGWLQMQEFFLANNHLGLIGCMLNVNNKSPNGQRHLLLRLIPKKCLSNPCNDPFHLVE